VPSQVALAISQSNASRNVYLGGLDEGTTEEQLRDDLSLGLIDQVKTVRDKNIVFVHFLNISVTTKVWPPSCMRVCGVSCIDPLFQVVNTRLTEPAWAGKRVNYRQERPLRVHPQVPASCRTSGSGCHSPIPCRAVFCGIAQPHQHQRWWL
jgi:hypothetical protein